MHGHVSSTFAPLSQRVVRAAARPAALQRPGRRAIDDTRRALDVDAPARQARPDSDTRRALDVDQVASVERYRDASQTMPGRAVEVDQRPDVDGDRTVSLDVPGRVGDVGSPVRRVDMFSSVRPSRAGRQVDRP
ncbi:hypothetical protein [Actinomadura sp. 9N215]|uniref:hypothetical protein n=1 Tax=Actinomadura sp. 9N215 TaxID=3375150 RepID=UPI00379EDA1F